MENNKLITATEKILETYKSLCNGEIAEKEALMIPVRYAKFLSQPLTLYMFVPCDDEGNVLEEPKITQIAKFQTPTKSFEDYQRIYNEAKSKVLFEGFKMCDRGDKTCIMTDSFHLNEFMWKNKTIETLVRYELTLSATALKQIYG